MPDLHGATVNCVTTTPLYPKHPNDTQSYVIFGALTGASAALIGVGFFGSLTFVAFVTACQAVTGLPGTGLAALALVFPHRGSSVVARDRLS